MFQMLSINYVEDTCIYLSKLEFKCEIKINKCPDLQSELSLRETLWNNYKRIYNRKISNEYNKAEDVTYQEGAAHKCTVKS